MTNPRYPKSELDLMAADRLMDEVMEQLFATRERITQYIMLVLHLNVRDIACRESKEEYVFSHKELGELCRCRAQLNFLGDVFIAKVLVSGDIAEFVTATSGNQKPKQQEVVHEESGA